MASSKSSKAKNDQQHENVDSDVAKKYEEIHFIDTTKPVWNYSLFTAEIISNYQAGTLYNAYEYFGSHAAVVLDTPGYYFAVWAPNATQVWVTGNFNDWQKEKHPLFVRMDNSGIWEGFIPNFQKGDVYKYLIKGFKGVEVDKGDTYANFGDNAVNTVADGIYHLGFKLLYLGR
ncbi:MAG: hypothetical protein ACOYKE_07795 [Ferruginibacter sp.]